MHGLREGDEDGRDAQLVVREILDDVGVEVEDAELVRARYAGEELHEEDLVVKGEALVVLREEVVQLFGEGLGVMEELKGGEIRSRGSIGSFCAVLRRIVSKRCEECGL